MKITVGNVLYNSIEKYYITIFWFTYDPMSKCRSQRLGRIYYCCWCHLINLLYCSQQAWMVHRAEQLKEQVGKLIATSSTCSLYQRIHLIDVLERLCLNHLFEEEINDVLYQMNNIDVSGCDLQTVAMWFYLLRKHGYRVSPGNTYKEKFVLQPSTVIQFSTPNCKTK